MKKIALLFLITVGLISCDETDPVIFDGSQTLVFFPNPSANLDVTIDDVGSVDIPINVTSLSDSDRTVTVEVDLDETTADPQNFSLASNTVTIPANEFTGFLTINGVDNTVEIDPELIIVNLVDFSDPTASISNASIQVNIKQVCPIPEGSFLGDYQMAQITPNHPENNNNPSFNNQVVTVQQATSGVNDRTVTMVWLEAEGIGQPASTIPFGLVCNEVVINSNAISTFLTCGNGGITLGRPNVNSTYDPDDDSFFELTLAEYVVDGGCGVPAPLQTTLGFTKI